MLQRFSSTFVLLLLAACQSTSGATESRGEWRSQIEQSHVQLLHEVQSLRSLIAEQALDPESRIAAGVGSAAESAGMVELTARLAALSGHVEQLNASMSLAGAARPAHAAHASAPAVTADPAPKAAIEALKQALLVFERQHALHCENLANVGMPGYKRRTLALTSVLDVPSGMRLPRASGITLDMAAGVLERTGASLDFGIDGEGFFEIRLPDGELRYTRNGSFRQDANGVLVTAEGYCLTDQVTVPQDSLGISISHEGQVFSIGEQNVQEQIGTIRLHVFPNAAGLEPVGGNGFAETLSSGPAQARQPSMQGAGKLMQGYIERSNVELTDELIELQIMDRQAAAVRRVLASHGIYTR